MIYFIFVICVCDIYTCIHLVQFSIQLHIAGVYHVCDECQLIEITVVYHFIVLLSQLHILLLGLQFHIALQIVGMCSLNIIVKQFGCYSFLF